MDFQKFYEGEEFTAYEFLGAHPAKGGGAVFRTFAINAERVTLIGDFNNWTETPMSDAERKGFYELFVPNARVGQIYKYVIYSKKGRTEHCDPYGFGMEMRPAFASVIRDLREYTFTDDHWMKTRTLNYDRPMNIFEIHVGSWLRKEGDPDSWYRYDEISDALIDYCRGLGYTHVEFMPLAEHPFDGSWGYQQTGFFAPTSRYGTAAQLKMLVDRLHNAGIGVILDFVPAHFANDVYGLREYDGTELYEYPSSDVSDSEWGTRNFNYSRREVMSFMQSSANYWLTEYHFDGIRMDAISRVIYWMGDEKRGVNETAVNFLKVMNEGLHRLHPTAMLIAEDSTSYSGCTKPVWEGGLGFDYKWDLGWMNDTLDYFMKQSDERKDLPDKLSFSMYYFYKERYLLPLSHDEVVHGKKTIIDKIFGEYEMKFPQARALYMYMMVHPGKMLNFMGNEFAMFREWDEAREPDYFLLQYPMHDSFRHFFSELGRIYNETPALYEMDYDTDGFRWLTINEDRRNIFGIQRYAKDRNRDSVIALFNFSNRDQVYCLHPERSCEIEEILNSDWERFSGGTKEVWGRTESAPSGEGVQVKLAAFSGVLFRVR